LAQRLCDGYAEALSEEGARLGELGDGPPKNCGDFAEAINMEISHAYDGDFPMEVTELGDLSNSKTGPFELGQLHGREFEVLKCI